MIKNFDYQFGIHSNIPECCVKWYQEKVDAGYSNIGETFRPEYLDNYWDISYVTCDECDEKVKAGTYVPNKIHLCRREPKAECELFLQEIYDYR